MIVKKIKFTKKLSVVGLFLVAFFGLNLFFSLNAFAEIKDQKTCHEYGGEWRVTKEGGFLGIGTKDVGRCWATSIDGLGEIDITKADEKPEVYVLKDQSRRTCPAGYRFSDDINSLVGIPADHRAVGNGRNIIGGSVRQAGCIENSYANKVATNPSAFNLEDEINKIKQKFDNEYGPDQPKLEEHHYEIIRVRCRDKDKTPEVGECVSRVAEEIYAPIFKQYQEKNADNLIRDCEVREGFGWLFCPGANFLSSAMESAYDYTANHFLNVNNKDLFISNNGPTFKSWNNFRNIANVIFAIIFMVMVFSQITNFGISNYGIKKMLPRMLVMAVLINVSWYICVIMVDLSNIIGGSIKDMLTGMRLVPDHHFANISQNVMALLTGATASGAGVLAVASAAGITFGVTAIFLSLLVALIGVFMMMFILTVRQGLIVILVVISPVAFALSIMPGTENLFDRWMKTFKSLLLVYPIAGAMVGAAILAGNILTVTAGGNVFLKVLYTLIPIFSFLASFSVIKGSLNAFDGLGNKLGGLLKKSTMGAAYMAEKTGLSQAADNLEKDLSQRRIDLRTKKGKKNRFYEFRKQLNAFRIKQGIVRNSEENEFNRSVAERAANKGVGAPGSLNMSPVDIHYRGSAAESSEKYQKDEISRRAVVRANVIMKSSDSQSQEAEAINQFIDAANAGNLLEMKSVFQAVGRALGGGKRINVLRKAISSIQQAGDSSLLQQQFFKDFSAYALAEDGKNISSKDSVFSAMIGAVASGNGVTDANGNYKDLQAFSDEFSTWSKVTLEQFSTQSEQSIKNIEQTLRHYQNAGNVQEFNSILESIVKTYNHKNLISTMGEKERLAYSNIISQYSAQAQQFAPSSQTGQSAPSSDNQPPQPPGGGRLGSRP